MATMATIIRILSRHGEPMAEINTAEAGRFVLSFQQPHVRYEIVEQPMLSPAPEQPTLWHQMEDQ